MLLPLCRLDVGRLLAFGALRHVEADFLAFFERLEALHLNRGEVREEVFAAVVRGDEPVTLRVVEPLHSSGCHALRLPLVKRVDSRTSFGSRPRMSNKGDAE